MTDRDTPRPPALAVELARLGARLGLERTPAQVAELLELRPDPPPPRGPRAPRPQRAAQARALALELHQAAEPVDVAADRPERVRWRPVDAVQAGSARRVAYEDRAARLGSLRLEDWQGKTWRIVGGIMADRSGRTASRWLAALPRAYAQRVRRAALCVERGPSGELAPRWSWRHIRARRRIALAVVAWLEAAPTRRRGWSRVVVGRSRGSWAALFPSSSERAVSSPSSRSQVPHVSVSLLFGSTHHGSSSLSDCGDARALDRAGAWMMVQPPAHAVPPAHVGRGRDGTPRALGQVWISERCACDRDRDELAELAELEEEHAAPGYRAPWRAPLEPPLELAG